MESKQLETNLKSDLFLQIVVFGLTASLVSMLAVKLYPKELINPEKPSPTPPLVLSENINVEQKTIPDRISVPSVKMYLGISPGVIVDNQWTLYDDKVSWLSTSATLGNGNVILYAHNKERLFGDLKNLAVGEQIVVSAEDKKFNYTVTEKRQITPQDLDAVISEKNQLTLYTCDGSFDEKRLIVIATFESEDKTS